MIPVFDSLTHPTLSGTWGKKFSVNIETLISEMNQQNISSAFAVGIHDFEEYNHADFIQLCSKSDRLIPIAGIDVNIADYYNELKKIKELGFRGIKIHPRNNQILIHNKVDELTQIFKVAYELDLIVLFCTYCSDVPERFPEQDPYWALAQIMKNAPKTKIILLHGGVTRLLQYADLVRFHPHALLDISYTMMKYAGSSIELDIKYLFESFDQKICVGSDHPEYEISAFRAKLEELSENIATSKKEKIYYKNLENFIHG